MRTKPILGASLALDGLAFELADARPADGERVDDTLALEGAHSGPRPMTRIIFVEAPLGSGDVSSPTPLLWARNRLTMLQRLPGGVGAARTCALAAFLT